MSSLQDCLPGEAGRELIEDVGVKIESFRLLINKECRSWQEFFAVLKPPQLNLKHIEQRMMTNLLHYRVNYIVVCLVVYVLQIVFHPVMLLALLSVLLFSFYAIFILKKPVVLGDSVTINENGVKILTVCFSVLFLSVMGALEHLLWASIYSLVLCSLHMLLRPRSVTSSTNKLYEEMLIRGGGGFSIALMGGAGAEKDDADVEAGTSHPTGGSTVGTPSQPPLIASGILLSGPKKD